MSGIRGRNTRPEVFLRSALHARGFRFRLHVSDLPGKPDLVFPKHHAVIQVHGCFWHRHGCAKTTNPSTNVEFWQNKFRQNVERDVKTQASLEKLGWRFGLVWECALSKQVETIIIDRISGFLLDPSARRLEVPTCLIPSVPSGTH
jgi:DNA mismatch endonuclease (patch repair protein)